MKKAIAVISLASVLIAAAPATAFAHGHGGCGGWNAVQSPEYAVCAVEDCIEAGLHYHDGTAYAFHYYGDGHDYHQGDNMQYHGGHCR